MVRKAWEGSNGGGKVSNGQGRDHFYSRSDNFKVGLALWWLGWIATMLSLSIEGQVALGWLMFLVPRLFCLGCVGCAFPVVWDGCSGCSWLVDVFALGYYLGLLCLSDYRPFSDVSTEDVLAKLKGSDQ
ncbi:hypothetical protein U1Q18_021857 [Sarracenia purpurea var. burkii]